MKIKRR